MTRQSWIVGDLGFGDGGKGVEVARLTKKHGATLNIRWGGGANCAHNVVHEDFRHHTFRQFGSGSFYGADTYLGEDVRFDPVMYLQERNILRAKGVKTELYVHPRCIVVTPLHIIHSLYAAHDHVRGTTGNGVGVAKRYAEEYPGDELRVYELLHPMIVRAKMQMMRERLTIGQLDDQTLKNMSEHLIQIAYDDMQAPRYLSDIMHLHNRVVFEGHQGALLDAERGFKPFVTSSDTSMSGAIHMAQMERMSYEMVGVTRSYMTRHGAGPLFTESATMRDRAPEDHNRDEPDHLQGRWRVGWLDLELIWRGMWILNPLGGVQTITVSHMDRWWKGMQVAGRRQESLLHTPMYAYEEFKTEEAYFGAIESALETPITAIGRGKRVTDREERS